MIYGYARCSLAEEKGQDLNRQVRELKAAGAEEIITEREHGDSKIDLIRDKHLRLIIIGSITIDCRSGELDAMSSAFLKMAGVFSELELQMIRARVKSGMANAKAKGKQIGRPQTTKDDIPSTFFKHYPAYAAGKMNLSEFARVCNLSRPTVYKYLKLLV